VSNKKNRHIKTLAIIVISITLLGISVWNTQRKISSSTSKACIINPLSEATYSLNFTQEATSLLHDKGYKVDIYTDEEVTVQQLKNIKKYDLILLRVHSGVFEDTVWFFTGEEYDGSKYVLEQLAGEVHVARCPSDPELLFAVGSKYVRHYLSESLDGCLVILMGCDGLTGDDLASSFIDCGASGFIAWDGPVSLHHSDEAVLGFLELYLEGFSVEECLSLIESDDVYDSYLCYYCK
jgi:hypothetical protein